MKEHFSATSESLTLLAPGSTFIHFTNSVALIILGILFIPLKIFAFIYGSIQFVRKKKVIDNERMIMAKMLNKQYCGI